MPSERLTADIPGPSEAAENAACAAVEKYETSHGGYERGIYAAPEAVADAAVHAAYPIIHADVITEVVEWLVTEVGTITALNAAGVIRRHFIEREAHRADA